MIKVINSGISTSIQDMGRPGYFHLGIPMSGAMDRFSLKVANLLVGNKEDEAGLECVFIGPKIEFQKECWFAVTGANIPIFINGNPQQSWTANKVKKGDILSFGYLKSGARIYISFSGGINTKKMLGSRSTYTIGSLGGLNGESIKNNDTIPIGKEYGEPTYKKIDKRFLFDYQNQTELRMIKGLYWHRITKDSGDKFFSEKWTVASEADRMGYRFKGGTPLKFVERKQPFGAGSDPSNIVDGCYSYGSIQVPGGTEPIILHRDAVSGGGYFTIGAIISADMDIIGQLQPNKKIKFTPVNMDEALKARKNYNKKINDIIDFLEK